MRRADVPVLRVAVDQQLAEVRRAAADWLQDNNAPEHYVHLVLEGGTLDSEEQGRVFGEALPAGLRLGTVEG